uniref:C-type lectin domain-containing protein n=1 Tax=Cyprinus carpio carpio TaxID=630221 RepID=A0A9J8B4Z8_CYPCA
SVVLGLGLSLVCETGVNLTDDRDKLKHFLYFFSSEMKNWTESRRYCRERGASDHHQQQRGRSEFMGLVSVWIGLSDSDEEGRWKWVDGSTLTSGFWTSGEPNSYMGLEEDCVVASYGWNDCPCNEAFRWICEKTIF